MSDNGHKTINLPAIITIRDLAQAIDASPIEVIKTLMADFRVKGVPKGVVRRDLVVPLDAPTGAEGTAGALLV